MTTEERIRGVVGGAVNAPSGDNSQPWWFHLEANTLEVHMIPDKDNPILNFRLSGSYVALGALIENIAILASAAKLSCDMSILPEKALPYLIARILFSDSVNGESDPLASYVVKRATNRKPYRKEAPSAEIIADLLHSSNELESKSTVVVSSDDDVIKSTAQASSTMERVALETEAIHRLFFGNIVWNEEEELSRGMGLPIKTTELPPPIQLLFRFIKDWNKTKALNRIGLSFMASKANAATYAASPLVGVITVPAFEPRAYIDAGRLFERVWVKATKYGLAFQPVTGILFLAQRVLANETEDLHAEHLPSITKAYETIKTKFALIDVIPALYFRVGYAEEPSARTKRRAPEFR